MRLQELMKPCWPEQGSLSSSPNMEYRLSLVFRRDGDVHGPISPLANQLL